MTVAELQRIGTAPSPFEKGALLPTPRPTSDSDFGDTLADAVARVDGAQKNAESQLESFIAGEHDDLHEVMIAMNQAQLSFQLMTEVRNRMLEMYQELMRMQV